MTNHIEVMSRKPDEEVIIRKFAPTKIYADGVLRIITAEEKAHIYARAREKAGANIIKITHIDQ